MEFNVGDLLDNQYEVIGKYVGGMGVVYITRDSFSGKRYAVKSIKPELARDEHAVRRFRAEAYTWINLEYHPNIVQAMLYRDIEGQPLLFLDFVDGTDLQHLLEKEHRLAVAQALDFAVQFCRGMDYVHNKDLGGGRKGVVHRDIKPGNIMITRAKIVRITDFGLVQIKDAATRLTQDGTGLGTPLYMPPEQLQDARNVDKRADIYAFGAVFYEMLTGRPPITGDNLGSLVLNILTQQPQPPSELNDQVPPEVEEIVLKCLAKNREERYDTFAQLVEILEPLYEESLKSLPPDVRTCTVCGYITQNDFDRCPLCESELPAPEAEKEEEMETLPEAVVEVAPAPPEEEEAPEVEVPEVIAAPITVPPVKEEVTPPPVEEKPAPPKEVKPREERPVPPAEPTPPAAPQPVPAPPQVEAPPVTPTPAPSEVEVVAEAEEKEAPEIGTLVDVVTPPPEAAPAVVTPPAAPAPPAAGEEVVLMPDIAPVERPTTAYEMYLQIGHMYMQQGNWEQAAQEYQRALEVRPDLATACFNLGVIFYQQGDLERAEEFLQRALEVNPDYDKALKALERLRQVTPTGRPISGTQAGEIWVCPPDGSRMAYVPAGVFIMGSNDHERSERPQREVYLEAYYIDICAVTNAQFAKFVEETGHKSLGAWQEHAKPGRENHPVIYVSHDDAMAYCEWAGKRLPTEAEWEKAARGTDGRIYPWGNEWDPHRVNCYESGHGTTVPVDSYPDGASPYGCLNMIGNVWEWCADWYDPNYYLEAPNRNPQGPEKGRFRVLRGGCFNTHFYEGDLRCSARGSVEPAKRLTYVRGFRCAKTP